MLVTLSGGRGNCKLRFRNQGFYFLFIFLFVALHSLCGSHHVTAVFPRGSGLSRSSHGYRVGRT